jgi:beta-N-acetylhexosaminidase
MVNKLSLFKKSFIFIFLLVVLIILVLTGLYTISYKPLLQQNRELIAEQQELIQISQKLNLNISKYQQNEQKSLKMSDYFEIKDKNEKLTAQNQELKGLLQDEFNKQIKNFNQQKIKTEELNKLSLELNLKIDTVELRNLKEETKLSSEAVNSLVKSKEILLSNQRKIENQIQNFIQTKQAKGGFVNPLWQKTDSDLKILLDKLSLSEKVSQLLMFGFKGSNFNTDLEQYMKELLPTGVILMGSNVSNPAGTKDLISKLQNTNQQIPLFISVDQEGGVVKRVGWDKTSGQKNWLNMSADELCKTGLSRAKTLKEAGFNLNFSPVVDLSNPNTNAFINNRTISENPKIVSQKAKEYIKCHQDGGVFATLKHYPGHGTTTLDSHFDLPIVDISKEEWEKSDLLPFAENLEAEMIMAGHLVYSKIDSVPATQSKILIDQKLKKEMGYRGLVITDDMNQLHVSTNISVKEALKNAYNSGIDIVLYVGLPTSPKNIKQELEGLVKTGEISEDVVNQAVLRILKSKRRLGV